MPLPLDIRGIKFYPCQYSQYLILVKKLELLLNKSLEIEYTMSETMKDGIVVGIVSSYVSMSFTTYIVSLMSTHDQVHLMQLYVILFVSYNV